MASGSQNMTTYKAKNARNLLSLDTRASAIEPQSLDANNTALQLDFKQKSITGLTADYSGILSYRPYSSSGDWTGGPAHQLAFDTNGLHWHKSTNNTTWDSWRQLVTIADNTAAGGATNPVYINASGEAVATSYSLSASINAASVKNTFAYYSGTNAISSYPRIRNIGSARYPMDIYLYNDAGNIVGEIWYDMGNATNVTAGRWNFLSYSPNSTADTGTTGKYEYYMLPQVTTGRTGNASYDILTTKSTITTAQGGTGNTSYTASRLLYTNSATKLASSSIESNGSNLVVPGYINMKKSQRIVFYGNNDNTSPCAQMGYINELSGGKMHSYNDGNTYQTSGAFYIWSNGCDAGNDNGGIAIDNEGVTVYGAGDAGSNFTGVFRVINEDDISTGPRFLVKKEGACYFGKGLGYYISNDGSQYTGNAASATRINGTLAQATSDANRNIWVSSTTGADGIPNYVTTFTMNPSTKTLHIPSGGRVDANGGALYLGNSNNASWVYIQDMASQASGTPWKLTQAGVLTCVTVNANLTGNVTGNCTGNANTANYQNCVETNEIRYARNGNMASSMSLWQGWAFAEGKVAVINDWRFGNGNGGLAPIYGSKVYNAVWNDFAEYRESEETEGGRVLVSDGTGKLIRSTERLQPAARVISDTFGCSVGQSDTAKTPIGVAGRVLIYPYQDRKNYKVGDALCAAPNGTADIMTREEIIQYPDRIIGIVDEIPEYEVWDQVLTNVKYEGGEVGEKTHTSTPVNGRIWIYVR